jgi:hypothetical protein
VCFSFSLSPSLSLMHSSLVLPRSTLAFVWNRCPRCLCQPPSLFISLSRISAFPLSWTTLPSPSRCLSYNTLMLDEVPCWLRAGRLEQVCIRNSRREPFFQLNLLTKLPSCIHLPCIILEYRILCMNDMVRRGQFTFSCVILS